MLEPTGVAWPRIGRALGDASYSIYLVHLMVASTYFKLTGITPEPGMATRLLTIAAILVLSSAAGLIAYRLVERPAIRALRSVSFRGDLGRPSTGRTG